MFSFHQKTTPRVSLSIAAIKEEGDTITLVFNKPRGLTIQPGQCLSLYPFRHLPREAMKPLTLALASGTNDNTIEITFSKATHIASVKYVLQHYKVGNSMLVEGPFGTGFSMNHAAPILLIGAGTGLSLLRSIKHSTSPNTAISLIYSAQKKQNVPYFNEVNKWAADKNNYLTLTKETDVPKGWHTGRMTTHLQECDIDPATRILICGPDAFIKDTVTLLREKKHPLENIFASSNWIKDNDQRLIFSMSDEKAHSLLQDESNKNMVKKNEMTYPTSHYPSELMTSIITNATAVHTSGLMPKEQMLSMCDVSQIEFAVYGEHIFDLMIREIQTAKRQVIIQTFVWDKRTKIIQDLQKTLKEIGENKIKSGDTTPLDVFILIDELGSLAQTFYLQTKPKHWPHTPRDIGLGDLPENIRVHVGVHHHNGLNSTHSKTVIVDNDALIITGANFQFSNYGPDRNYDAGMLLKGAPAQSAVYDFAKMWELRSNVEEENISPINNLNNEKNNQPTVTTITPENQANVLCLASLARANGYVPTMFKFTSLPDDPINQAFITALKEAKHIVRIATPNLNEPMIIEALAEFINKRNGSVELLMGLGFNDQREKWYGGTNEQTVAKLIACIDPDKRDLLNIRWYSPNQEKIGAIHVKFMAIDDQVTIFGSADLDKVSLYHCHETNVVIDHANLTKQAVTNIFTPAWESSISVENQKKQTLALSF